MEAMETYFQVQHNSNLIKCPILSKHKLARRWLIGSIVLSSFLFSTVVKAQVTPDGSTSTTVDADGNDLTINQGDRVGNNLFHSFSDFSVPDNGSAVFNNPADIANIFSRVTGGNISNIDGLLGANGTANLFLINPAGIIFGNNARLDVGGSFLGSTADSILFPDGEFSASDLNAPVLTINAPIGLNFRDNPGDIVNRSLFTDDTGTLIGLDVPEDQTIGLIGGDVLIEEGFITTTGGRIELGSVGENSSVSLTEIEKGWDVGYEGVENFGNIELSGAAFVNTFGANTGDIEVQGGKISLIEGSQIGLETEAGQAGNLTVIASESLSLDGNAVEFLPEIGDIQTRLFNDVFAEGTGTGSQININTPQLSITNGGQINAAVGVAEQSQGVDIFVNADNIVMETPFIDNELGILQTVGIFAQVGQNGLGDSGNITIETDTLSLNEGGAITTDTFGEGNAGDLTVNASESIELTGTIPNSNDPSALSATVGNMATATGNGGNLTLNTPNLVVRDGAQITTVARNSGNGGTLTIDAESILLTGTAPLAEFQGGGRSGIFVSAQPSFTDPDSGGIIPTTGDGGTLNLTTEELTIEQGAFISVNTFSEGNGGDGNINVDQLTIQEGGQIGAGSLIEQDSIDPEADRGNGGTLNINATESVEILGIGSINDEPVNSSIFTLAESTGNAGNITLTTNNLTVSDDGNIDTSSSALGAAGNLTITGNSLDLNQGTLTAATPAGTGGNIQLEIDNNITLSNNSLISAAATGLANGGNIDIDTTFIIASPQSNSDIIASAGQDGMGGNITIDAESIFGNQARPQSDLTNDLDASGGVDGEVIINTPDVDLTSVLAEVPQNVVTPEQTTAQACRRDRQTVAKSVLTIKGKGGIPPEPGLPLNAFNITINGKTNSTSTIPAPIETSQGKIQPARGIKITESGEVILTAYRTNNSGDRIPDSSTNCDRVQITN